MKKNKLLYLFKSLSTEELRTLGKYLPHANIRYKEKVLALYRHLKEHIHQLDPTTFDKTTTFEAIEGTAHEQRPASHQRLVMSDLSLAIEDFWVARKLQQHSTQHDLLLAETLNDHQLYALSLDTLKQAQKHLEQAAHRDRLYHYQGFQLHERAYFHPNIQASAGTQALQHLTKATNHLDRHYLLTKLCHACEMLLMQRVHGKEQSLSFPAPVWQLICSDQFADDPLIQLHQTAIQLLQQPNVEGYQQFKQAFMQHSPLNRQAEQEYLFGLLLNIATLSVAPNQRLQEIFSLYQWGLSQGTFLHGGYLRTGYFNNITAVGCALKKFDWVQQFINNYIQYLNDNLDHRRNIKRLFEATLLFWQGDYKKTIRKLRNLEFEDFSYGLRKHNLLIRSVYEVDQRNPQLDLDIPTLCKSYRRYVDRKFKSHYISQEIRDAHVHFIRLVRKLQDCSQSRYSRYSVEELRHELARHPQIAAQQWLRSKLEMGRT